MRGTPIARCTRLLAAGAACTLVAAPAALAAPGVPAAPVPLFAEGFENVSPPATPLLVGAYVGFAPLSPAYTGDPAWIDGSQCNGVVTSGSSADYGGGCGPGDNAANRGRASDLGLLNGTVPPSDNHAVGSSTFGNPGAGVQLATATPIPLPAPSRFVRFAMNVSVTNCPAGRPSLMPYVLDGAARLQTFSAPIDPCPGIFNQTATFAAARAVLVNGPTTGIEIVNGFASGVGNDLAIDDLALLDATPQLDLSFGAPPAPGAASRLTLTITNTTDLLQKAGWSFTATLPSGLRVAPVANAATTCANGTVGAPASGSAIAVAGELDGGAPSCTVQADVVADAPGTYAAEPASVAPRVGVNPPAAPATVTFQAPPPPQPPAPPPPPDPPPVPEQGKSVVIGELGGTVRVKLPGSSQYVDLAQLTAVPLGARIDAREGKVRITGEVDSRTGRTQSATFYTGLFDVLQSGGRRPVIVARLAGGDFTGCSRRIPAGARLPKAARMFGFSAKPKRGKRRVRRLWGHGEGDFRTDGRRSTAVVRGTWWYVEDRCDGTLTYVRKGRVDVRDLRLRKTIRLAAGRAYLAKAP